ncbi:MAG: tRNA adenosine(34) deaminase TadA [Candidatus Hatepunaea meridiana]|nr:tRNA adenosine(34) deaminase TadA [Candidatus Hatepunaea meridiana]
MIKDTVNFTKMWLFGHAQSNNPTIMLTLKNNWMKQALLEARKALADNEVPVGAVVVKDDQLLGRGYNRTQALTDPTAHAEILAITSACQTLNSEHLKGADIYVTLEPCAMCAGAIVLARISRLYFAVHDLKTGACGSVFDIVREPRLNHTVEVYSGIYADESEQLLKDFFERLRNNTIVECGYS